MCSVLTHDVHVLCRLCRGLSLGGVWRHGIERPSSVWNRVDLEEEGPGHVWPAEVEEDVGGVTSVLWVTSLQSHHDIEPQTQNICLWNIFLIYLFLYVCVKIVFTVEERNLFFLTELHQLTRSMEGKRSKGSEEFQQRSKCEEFCTLQVFLEVFWPLRIIFAAR